MTLLANHRTTDYQGSHEGQQESLVDGGQSTLDTHTTLVPIDQFAAQKTAELRLHTIRGVEGGPHSTKHMPNTTALATNEAPNNLSGTADFWLTLRIWSEMFSDAQQQRIAMINRAEHGGIDPRVFAPFIEQCEKVESVAQKELVRTYKGVPESIRRFQEGALGVGDHMMARLLGHLGHPVHATPYAWADKQLIELPPFDRTLSQLRQYCGHGSPAVRRRGITQEEAMENGSPTLKMIVHLIAESILKNSIRKVDGAPDKFSVETRYAKSPLGQVYLDAREATIGRMHSIECRRCGPSGKPAQPGSPWNDGHAQAHALRMVGKEFLRGLYFAS